MSFLAGTPHERGQRLASFARFPFGDVVSLALSDYAAPLA